MAEKPHKILKKLRKLARFSQGDIAKILGMGRPNYGQKENGKVALTANELLLVLDFLKNHISENEYLDAVTDLLGSQAQPTKNITNKLSTPSPIDPAIEILQEFLQEEGKEIAMEKAGPLIQLVRDMIAEEDHSGNEAYTLLSKLEKLSIKEYYRIFGDIKETVTELEKKQKDLKASGD
ncbi:MAG: helix-turn-helix transcriptional regulator [Desulfobacteraceae bacterium]|nr:helix-turn-helix transcriptional regulator [Desulfobacteraceae bacterium]